MKRRPPAVTGLLFFLTGTLLLLTGCDDGAVRSSPEPPANTATAPAAQSDSAEITLTDSTGRSHTPLAAGGRATVLIFLMKDCPVANSSAPELARVAAEFGPQGVHFYGVYATELAAEIDEHLAEYSLPFPGLPDPQLRLARRAGATRVPEAAVFSSTGTLLYRGRIDDRAVRPGITKPEASRRDLRLAVEAVITGHQVETPLTEVVGCYLPEAPEAGKEAKPVAVP